MKFTKTILPNGLRLITVPMKDNKTVTAMVLVEAGSRYETRENNGISHFLEHMCFKGTKKRPSALSIATEFESLGSHYNAFTSNSYTGYFGKVASGKSETILDIVSDLYLNATLPKSEIEKEKNVVIEEINMGMDRPERIVWDVLDEIVYGEHPLGRTVIGSKETVNSFDSEALETYRRMHYVPGKTVVTIAGGFDEASMISLVEASFGQVPKSEIIPYEKVIENQTAPRVKIFQKKTDQAHLVLGYRSFDSHDKRTYAASLLRSILGSGMSSRLFHRLREQLGLCYYVYASQKMEEDCGLFTISAGVSPSKLEQSVTEIKKIIDQFVEQGPTMEELQKAKDHKIGGMYLELETSNDLSEWYAFQEIDHDELLTPEEYENRLRSVTLDEVWSVARDIFVSQNANLAVVGNVDVSEASLLALF